MLEVLQSPGIEFLVLLGSWPLAAEGWPPPSTVVTERARPISPKHFPVPSLPGFLAALWDYWHHLTDEETGVTCPGAHSG